METAKTMIRIATGLVFAGLSTPLAAQWLNHPTAGIPRKADGTPNLSAPAPRMPDGTPDLTGIWEHMNSRTTAYYLDGIDIPWQPWAEALFKQRQEDNQKDNPESRCLPRGLPKADAFDIHKIVQSPGLVVVLYEYETTYRQIFTDGRTLPREFELPAFLGYSVGHWERDVFVVETAGFNGKTRLDLMGHPQSEAMRITERFHRRDFGHLDVEMTFDDPKMYTKPFTIKVSHDLLPDSDIFEMFCNENEKDRAHLQRQ